jgi:hypothetical protein
MGSCFLVLVVASLITELINRNFGHAAIWCLVAAAFSWVGMMHSATFRWSTTDVRRRMVSRSAIVYSARWWRGDVHIAG